MTRRDLVAVLGVAAIAVGLVVIWWPLALIGVGALMLAGALLAEWRRGDAA